MNVLVVIAFYAPAYRYGGPVRSLAALCEGLTALDVNVRVLTTNADGNSRLNVPLGEPLRRNGVEVIYTPLPRQRLIPASFFYAPALNRAFRDHRAWANIAYLDVWWTHAALCGAAAQRVGIPYIVPLRGQLLPYGWRGSGLKKWLYLVVIGRRFLNEAAAVHCTSEAEAAAYRTLGFRPPTLVIPNAIDLTRFAGEPPPQGWRARLNIPTTAPLILFVGRLHPKKRPDLAVHMLSLPHAHVILVGADEGGMIPALRDQAQRLEGGERFHWLNVLDGADLAAAYAAADLLIMPSEPESENFGNVILEAAACGLPFVATDDIPAAALLAAHDVGQAIPFDRNRFYAAAKALLTDRPTLRAMGERGRIAVHAFAPQRVAMEMANACEQLCASS